MDFDFQSLNKNITPLWLYPTPVYMFQFTEGELQKIQEEMLGVYNKIKQEFKVRPDWNSHHLSDATFRTNLLHKHPMPVFEELLKLHLTFYVQLQIGSFMRPYKIEQSWMTLTKKGEYGHIHTHGDADISGCYYIKTNGNDGHFLIPCSQKPLDMNKTFGKMSETTKIEPRVGRMLLFPGWMDHGVGTNATENERISFSFNIKFER